MKKIYLSMLFFIIPTLLCACGDTSEVNIVEVQSDIYTEEDINSGINLVISHFKKNFDGCDLHKISYVGDERKDELKEWQNQYNMDEVIIFETDFFASDKAEACFNPNCEYTNFMFILARNKGETWEYKDGGY